MIPDNISKEHVLKAILNINNNGIEKKRKSKSYQLKYNNELYPPKYLISLANKYANNEILEPDTFSGGAETNNFLIRLGFEIVNKDGTVITNEKESKSESKPKHDERCSECKNTIIEMFRTLYGTVKIDYKFNIPTNIDEFKSESYYKDLLKILNALKNNRGYTDFIRTKNLNRCDLYIPNPGFIVELDESQHFTKARRIALQNYPKNLKTGFNKNKWINICRKINAKDNHPAYRDEQRAWYDTIRDFIYIIKRDMQPTVRIYMGDYEWCSLDPCVEKDIKIFQKIVNKRSGSTKFKVPEKKYEKQNLNINDIKDIENNFYETLYEFEYCLQHIKLLYLEYLASQKINTKILDEPSIKDRIFRNPDDKKNNLLAMGTLFGKAASLFCGSVYIGGGHGSLSGDMTPLFMLPGDERERWKSLLSKLGKLNKSMKLHIKILHNHDNNFESFLRHYSEYIISKVTIHELIVDLEGFFNIDKCAYLFIEWLSSYLEKSEYNPGDFREVIVLMLRLGISPLDSLNIKNSKISKEQIKQYLKEARNMNFNSIYFDPRLKTVCSMVMEKYYKYFKSNGMSQTVSSFLSHYMTWNKYAMCAFDTGPIFIRKNKRFTLEQYVNTFKKENYRNMDEFNKKVIELNLSKHINFIANPYDEFRHELDVWQRDDKLRGKYLKRINEFYNKLESRIIS